MGSLVGPGNSLVKDSFLICLACWAILLVSGAALLDGSLKLRYNTIPFARKKPTWRLPSAGTSSWDHCGFWGGCALGECSWGFGL